MLIMPHANIYIRKADYAQWLKIEDKPTFISNAILDYSKAKGLGALKHIVDRRTNIVNIDKPIEKSFRDMETVNTDTTYLDEPTVEPFEENA
jgi:hypothetical protein